MNGIGSLQRADQQVSRELAVPSAIGQLERAAAALEETASLLLARLEPVLRSSLPGTGAKDGSVRPVRPCGLAESVGSASERVQTVYELLRDAVERLEV